MTLPRKVYFIGIGGTAMGNLAVCLKGAGIDVSGSDNGLYPPISHLLEANEIPVTSPEDTDVLKNYSDGIVVVGNAVSRGHPQVEWLLENAGVARTSFPSFVGSFLLSQTKNLVVAGTHGKSTTTAAAAGILRGERKQCGWFVGGVMADNSPAFSWSVENEFFAVEGDEYDSAFFDKRSKFVHYRPLVLVLNNLEFDHADIFRDVIDVQRSFRQCISLVPASGVVLFNGDDDHLRGLLPVDWTQCYSFGFGEENDFLIVREVGEECSKTKVVERATGQVKIEIWSTLIGAFNSRNVAAAALGAGFLTGAIGESERVLDLRWFEGLKRRQEVRFRNEDYILVEDFGHHPTALGLALEALRETYPGWRIHAMVEPRSNTMRTNLLGKELERALSRADSVTIAPIHRKDSIPVKNRLDLNGLQKALRQQSIDCTVCEEDSFLLSEFRSRLGGAKTLTVVFSNGAFGGWLDEFERILSAEYRN